jgi:DNA-binding NtrC family response regulator
MTPTLLGSDPTIAAVRRAVAQVAPTDATVLILGETGTGKELVARAVHAGSRRVAKPFVPVSGVALSPGLIVSELFGHEAGAFTGAARRCSPTSSR